MVTIMGFGILYATLFVTDVAVAQRKFLGTQDQHLGGSQHGVTAVSDLLSELEQVVGRATREVTESRVDRLEEALRPMAAAMPKDSAGLLDATSVRYLLHRLFVQRHGWSVTGLQTAGDSWNSSSPAQVFKKHADDVHSLFESKLTTDGFNVHQVAVFAAMLEALVHNENVQRLTLVTELLGLQNKMTEEDVMELMRGYMAMFVISVDLDDPNIHHYDVAETIRSMPSYYPTWSDTEVFVREVRERILADVTSEERTSWDNTLRVLEEVGERYGRWQDSECRTVKAQLVEMEDPNTGRVPLDRFYGGISSGTQGWQFMESVPYLRQLGALDESDPQRMRVIIPNYMNSLTNCVASSRFYSVCCIDECEGLLGTLEEKIAAPIASPDRVMELVSDMPSDTVKGQRVLSAELRQRLEEIASHHGGKVPLHGRLFAQWLHHAYPRECSYPHMSGATNPMTPGEYRKMTGKAIDVAAEEVTAIMNSSSYSTPEVVEETLEWTVDEELFVCRGSCSGRHHVEKSLTREFMSLALVTSMGFAIRRMYKQATFTQDVKLEKHLV